MRDRTHPDAVIVPTSGIRPSAAPSDGTGGGTLKLAHRGGLPLNAGYGPVPARVLSGYMTADQPVAVQRGNPAQRAGCRHRRRPAGEQEAFPHVHLLVVGLPGRTDRPPSSQPDPPGDPGGHFPGSVAEGAVRASALARTMSGSRGSGESASGHRRSLRTFRRAMRIRFIADLPRAIDRARARVGCVVSLAGAGVLGLSLVLWCARASSRIIGQVAGICGSRWYFPAGRPWLSLITVAWWLPVPGAAPVRSGHRCPATTGNAGVRVRPRRPGGHRHPADLAIRE